MKVCSLWFNFHCTFFSISCYDSLSPDSPTVASLALRTKAYTAQKRKSRSGQQSEKVWVLNTDLQQRKTLLHKSRDSISTLRSEMEETQVGKDEQGFQGNCYSPGKSSRSTIP